MIKDWREQKEAKSKILRSRALAANRTRGSRFLPMEGENVSHYTTSAVCLLLVEDDSSIAIYKRLWYPIATPLLLVAPPVFVAPAVMRRGSSARRRTRTV